MHILIVDNETASRSMLQKAVEHLGHYLRVATTGNEAWDLLQKMPADVVISAWKMPGMDGIDLFHRVRSLPSDVSYTYFIFSIDSQDREDFLGKILADVDDYLLKPLDAIDLSIRLKVAERVTSLYRQVGDQRRELEDLNHRLFDQARRDALTGLSNRMRLQEDLEMLRSQALRYGYSFSVLLFDVDRFKLYNDQYGHTAGDDVLRTVGSLTLSTCRGGDTAYRYGGEEFMVILPEQGLEPATLVAERLRAAIEEVGIPHPDNLPSQMVTISVGIATLARSDAPDTSLLLQQVDAALHQAKSLGRNRVRAFGSDTPTPALPVSG